MPSPCQKRRTRQTGERGYVLLSLLLMMAIMAIVAATMVTSMKFEIQRDREEEMIHRGVQYSRAIRAYYKKFGRYPATIDNLVNTNQMRFLRKRYKDPITGKDFKLLHFGEVKMGLAAGIGGGGVIGGASTIPGASTIGPNGTLTANGASDSTSGNTTFGNSSSSGQSPKAGTDSSQNGDSGSDTQPVSSTGTSNSTDQSSSDQPVQTFGGMPIVGVASFSKGPTIREFDKKKKYNDWLFVYDPTLDRGLLIKTPYQPQMQMFGMVPQNMAPAQNPTPGLGTSAPGTTAPPTAPPNSNNTLGNPNQPTDTPVQQ